jgi:hypothetical protein
VAAQKDSPRNQAAKNLHRIFQAGSILCGVSRRRSDGPALAERKIATKYGEPLRSEQDPQANQQGRSTIGSRAMGDDQALLVRDGGAGEKAAHFGMHRGQRKALELGFECHPWGSGR